MANIIIAPGKYIQGQGELNNIGAIMMLAICQLSCFSFDILSCSPRFSAAGSRKKYISLIIICQSLCGIFYNFSPSPSSADRPLTTGGGAHKMEKTHVREGPDMTLEALRYALLGVSAYRNIVHEPLMKEVSALLEAVNTALNELIDDGTVQAIMDKYIAAE